MKIKFLPEVLINKIAAGEVIDRPASVIRELIDNSIDAGATSLDISIENGGKSIIKVQDDGHGMLRDDAVMAFERHATSKIELEEDLFNLHTKGFRGEALSSIASVAKVVLTTRTHDSSVGTRVTMMGGSLKDVSSVSCAPGTSIEISNLFFNTPVRRKFLRSDQHEAARIKTLLSRVLIPHYKVRLRFSADGKNSLSIPSHVSFIDRSGSLLTGEKVPFQRSEGEFQIEGFLGHPGFAINDNKNLMVFINGRLVTDRLLYRAIKEGYGSSLKPAEYPSGIVQLHLPLSMVDVNVHPQKSEVRFVSPQEIFRFVQQSIARAVATFTSAITPPLSSAIVPQQHFAGNSADTNFQPTLMFSSETTNDFTGGDSNTMNLETINSRTINSSRMNSGSSLSRGFLPPRGGVSLVSASSLHTSTQVERFRFRQLNYIGQLFGCYLLCSHKDDFVVIDMHAAHERINFNRIRKRNVYKGKDRLASQRLLQPIKLSLNPEEIQRISDAREDLEIFGIDIELSDTHVSVLAAPPYFRAEALTRMIKEISFDEDGYSNHSLERNADMMAARLACHASVRSGDLLSRQEVEALFSALDEAELSGACPHGRPVVVSFTTDQVERWFGRDK